MSLTLSDSGTTLALNPDLYWSDENTWHPVEQTADRTITGALIVQAAGRIAGRPVTLEPQDDSAAWMSLADVTALRYWAAVPGKTMTLTLRGVERDVIFRHQDGGFEARPVIQYRDGHELTTDFYRCTIRLMEI